MEDCYTSANVLSFIIGSDWSLSIYASPCFMMIVFLIILVIFIVRHFFYSSGFRSLELDGAEFGIGKQKIKLKPNIHDRQIAYQIWVELSTRKIGLPIDLENDVLSEVYDSWYNFFSITRDLLRDIPSSKFRREDTKKIIELTIEVLNEGLRPHLTKWQARYRRWYENEMNNNLELDPQEIQKTFPKYDELREDLEVVNERLMRYREKMHSIVSVDY